MIKINRESIDYIFKKTDNVSFVSEIVNDIYL